MSDPEMILSELTSEKAADWQYVGEMMRRLNRISEVSVEGRAWHDVMLEHLAANGHQMSSGHLHRIRRAFDFLEVGMNERGLPKERARLAKISSLDQAERLFQLDRDAGLDALEACLDIKKPATKDDIQKRYKDFLTAHPEKKTPMQAAWDRRRSKKEPKASEVDTVCVAEVQPTNIPMSLRVIADHVTELETASREDAARIEELERELLDITAELTETKQSLQIVSEELKDIKDRKSAGWD